MAFFAPKTTTYTTADIDCAETLYNLRNGAKKAAKAPVIATLVPPTERRLNMEIHFDKSVGERCPDMSVPQMKICTPFRSNLQSLNTWLNFIDEWANDYCNTYNLHYYIDADGAHTNMAWNVHVHFAYVTLRPSQVEQDVYDFMDYTDVEMDSSSEYSPSESEDEEEECEGEFYAHSFDDNDSSSEYVPTDTEEDSQEYETPEHITNYNDDDSSSEYVPTDTEDTDTEYEYTQQDTQPYETYQEDDDDSSSEYVPSDTENGEQDTQEYEYYDQYYQPHDDDSSSEYVPSDDEYW